MRKIEPVVMDYEGEPVSIEDGEMLWWFADEGQHWNSDTLQFEDDEDDEPDYFCVYLDGDLDGDADREWNDRIW